MKSWLRPHSLGGAGCFCDVEVIGVRFGQCAGVPCSNGVLQGRGCEAEVYDVAAFLPCNTSQKH